MWKQGFLSILLDGLSKTFQNENKKRTGNQSGYHPSCGLELWPSYLHITLVWHKGLASTCCGAEQATCLPQSLSFFICNMGGGGYNRVTEKLIMGVKVSFKLWNTHINVGISHS